MLYVVPVFFLPLLMEAVATVKCTSFVFQVVFLSFFLFVPCLLRRLACHIDRLVEKSFDSIGF